MAAEVDHAEVPATIEAGLAQLKAWLDMRLQQQDELLRCISHDCQMLRKPVDLGSSSVKDSTCPHSDKGEEKERPEVAAMPSEIGAPRTTAPSEPDDSCPSTSLHEVQDLPGFILEASTDPVCQVHVASAELESFPDSKKHDKELGDTSGNDQELQPETVVSFKGQDYQRVLMDIFDHLDFDHSGSISFKELIEAFTEADIQDVEALKVFQCDTTGDGLIDRVEWLHLCEDAAHNSSDEMKILLQLLNRLTIMRRSSRSIFGVRDGRRKPCLMLRHDSPWRMTWDLSLCILLFYVSITVPFTLGFGENGTLKEIDLAVDLFFCCDVVLNFRTSFMDNEGSIVFDGKRIAMKYLKSWFFLDFISSVPFDAITNGLLPNLTPARLLKIGKIAKVMKLLRITKIMTAVSESELMESVDHFLTSRSYQTYGRLIKLLLMMFVAAHWLACFGSLIDSSSIDAYFADGIETPSDLKRYLAGMYWSITTLSTVGYGDITPQTDEERAYAIVAMVIGGALYGYVVGSVTSLVTHTDVRTHAYHERMELIYSWLDCHSVVPTALRRRLRNYFRRTLAVKSVMDDSAIIGELSPELRADIACFLVHNHVRQHPMFIKNPNSTLAKLVEVLRKNHVNAYERVVRVGDPGTAMYILVEGLGRYEQGMEWLPENVILPHMATKFQKVVPGNSFGEEIIFHLTETYSYTIVALKVCDFHSISEDDFKSKYKNMPELRDQMFQAYMESIKARALVLGTSFEDSKLSKKASSRK